ncbi:MAG: hypothetical protein A2Y04_05650 [Omnitrophica WOR_2 bacterium GWC2_45_7]|nr:MAG: hypothetical protein A2Y04_05650 [Omnitrophica WOR_2 bacterium GWC2_45_7]
MENKVLGKGLLALISEKNENNRAKEEYVAYIKTELIRDNSQQPRTNYDDTKLNDLKASIKEKGVLQPILVRKKDNGFEVIAGERRLRAARALNMNEIPVIVREATDQEALVIALVENIQREELNPIEEAEAYKRLIEEFLYTQETVAQSVGKDRSTVSNLLRLLKLPKDIQKNIYNGNISVGHARALLSLESLSEQSRIVELILKKGLSVREVEKLVKQETKLNNVQEKKEKTKANDIVFLEEELQRMLGTKVRIDAQKKRGKIVIEYYSLDDLERIMKSIKK